MRSYTELHKTINGVYILNFVIGPGWSRGIIRKSVVLMSAPIAELPTGFHKAETPVELKIQYYQATIWCPVQY